MPERRAPEWNEITPGAMFYYADSNSIWVHTGYDEEGDPEGILFPNPNNRYWADQRHGRRHDQWYAMFDIVDGDLRCIDASD